MSGDARGRPLVTVYWYSQTGQLREVLSALVQPLQAAGATVTWREIVPARSYPFPWPMRRFFGVFPSAVDPEETIELAEPSAGTPTEPSDLVILGYQVWYLRASPPARSFVESGPLRGAPVLAVTACRNMWYSAALDMRARLLRRGARYVGTVAAVDTAPAPLTFVTTVRWLLTGRREPGRGLPAAGVGPEELARVSAVGAALVPELARANASDRDDRVGRTLRASAAAPIVADIAAADLLGGRAFTWWGRLIRASGHGPLRALLLGGFACLLGCCILVVTPALALTRLVAGGRLTALVRRQMDPVA